MNKIKSLGLSIDWTKVSREDVIKALRLYDHSSIFFDAQVLDLLVLEIQRRAISGDWLDLDLSPAPLENLPGWLKIWPFRLFWKQGVVVAPRCERRNQGERVMIAPRT